MYNRGHIISLNMSETTYKLLKRDCYFHWILVSSFVSKTVGYNYVKFYITSSKSQDFKLSDDDDSNSPSPW